MSASSSVPPPINENKQIIQLSHRSNNVPVPHIIPVDSLSDTNPKAPMMAVPPTLFLHGLDSSSQTWNKILSDHLNYPGVAVDLRGCGLSPLGDPGEFSPDAIVEDLLHFVRNHSMFRTQPSVVVDEMEGGGVDGVEELRPFVIVGHSMGGRIAMTFAAKYPEYVSALIIEDMDIRRRPMSMNMVSSSSTRDETLLFDRTIRCQKTNNATEDDVINAFKPQGYDEDWVRRWLRDGRITWKANDDNGADSGGYYYSDVNPAFRLLCYENFFDSNHGEETWKRLGEICRSGTSNNIGTPSISSLGFPCHVMVAGDEGTVCDESSIRKMKEIIGDVIIHRYSNAGHSIHGSELKKYVCDIRKIIREASVIT